MVKFSLICLRQVSLFVSGRRQIRACLSPGPEITLRTIRGVRLLLDALHSNPSCVHTILRARITLWVPIEFRKTPEKDIVHENIVRFLIWKKTTGNASSRLSALRRPKQLTFAEKSSQNGLLLLVRP